MIKTKQPIGRGSDIDRSRPELSTTSWPSNVTSLQKKSSGCRHYSLAKSNKVRNMSSIDKGLV